MPGERRKSRRMEAGGDFYRLPARMSRRVRCTLKNLSVTGACIVSRGSLATGDLIALYLESGAGGALRSRVVWSLAGEYGVEFLLENGEEFETISRIINNRRTT